MASEEVQSQYFRLPPVSFSFSFSSWHSATAVAKMTLLRVQKDVKTSIPGQGGTLETDQ